MFFLFILKVFYFRFVLSFCNNGHVYELFIRIFVVYAPFDITLPLPPLGLAPALFSNMENIIYTILYSEHFGLIVNTPVVLEGSLTIHSGLSSRSRPLFSTFEGRACAA